jgi:hypothetical protein
MAQCKRNVALSRHNSYVEWKSTSHQVSSNFYWFQRERSMDQRIRKTTQYCVWMSLKSMVSDSTSVKVLPRKLQLDFDDWGRWF